MKKDYENLEYEEFSTESWGYTAFPDKNRRDYKYAQKSFTRATKYLWNIYEIPEARMQEFLEKVDFEVIKNYYNLLITISMTLDYCEIYNVTTLFSNPKVKTLLKCLVESDLIHSGCFKLLYFFQNFLDKGLKIKKDTI